MAWFKKKVDPVSERARALNAEIAALETKIKQLDSQLQKPHPKLRSTAVPHGGTIAHATTDPSPSLPAQPVSHEPVFEDIQQETLSERPETANTREHYNELGVRKYDVTVLWQRIKSLFQGPTTTNPRLVTYLAAGGVQGLKPLRYEKRVARNRFLVFAIGLLLLLIGICFVFLRNH